MGRFNLNFLDHPTRTVADPKDYEDYFLNYSKPKWRTDPSGASFRYRDDDKVNYTCTLAHAPDYGILVWLRSNSVARRETYWDYVSLHNADELDEMVDVSSEEYYPVGCFIGPKQAWELVKAFLLNPTEEPKSDLLISTSRLPPIR